MFKPLSTPARLIAGVVHVIGVRRLALLGTGAALGALLTPVAGPELRRRVALEIAKRRSGAEPTVEERVRRRLADSPRTWHLPQPEVVAVRDTDETDWRIILAGTAPDESARTDLEETVLSVTGVADVDNRIRVNDREA
ncbi:MAG TPA: BON domain-containing protein [Acidimicrobiales bacterium]|nr:BON domain-containing protein [Acidimicrobiales bacterium]